MFYKKKLKLTPPASLKVKLSNFMGGVNKEIDENLLPINYAKMAYNLSYKNKALNTGLGVKILQLPNLSGGVRSMPAMNDIDILGCWLFPRMAGNPPVESDLIFFYGSDKKLYYSSIKQDANTFLTYPNFTYESLPYVLKHKYEIYDVMVMSAKDDYLAIWDGRYEPSKIVNTLNLTSACVHYERLFATTGGKKDTIRFSDDFNLANWRETAEAGGFIQLVDERGKLNRVVSFKDYVFIFRERGISRLSAYGSQNSFSVTHLFSSNTTIFHETIAVCGDIIIMLCSDGLYYFTGANSYKFDFKINDLFNKDYLQYARGLYFNGKYYLSCRMNFDDGEIVGCENETGFINNALIEFDINTQTYNITRGLDICHLSAFLTDSMCKLVMCFRGENSHFIGELTDDGKFFGQSSLKKWQSPLSDFGYPEKVKVVRELSVLAKEPCTIVVKSERESREFHLDGNYKTQRICPNIQGSLIGVDFVGNTANFYVSNPNLIVDLID